MFQTESRSQTPSVARSSAMSSARIQEALLILGPITLSELHRPQAISKWLSLWDANPCIIRSNNTDQSSGREEHSFKGSPYTPRSSKHSFQIYASEAKCQRRQ